MKQSIFRIIMNKLRRTPVDRVNVLAAKMRKNGEEMCLWKNIPLAKECMKLLPVIDDSEASPMEKAFACSAILGMLPEYDVPRLVLTILRFQLEQVHRSTEPVEEGDPTEEDIQSHIERLEDYIDTDHMTADAFNKKYDRWMKRDPIERNEWWEQNYYEVEQECDRRLEGMPRGMGFCYAYWSCMTEVLAERGIEWRSPGRMNPRIRFD